MIYRINDDKDMDHVFTSGFYSKLTNSLFNKKKTIHVPGIDVPIVESSSFYKQY